MKLRILSSLIFTLTASISLFAAPLFAPSSRLASGKWVKVGIDQTGVYEISYEKLKAMGFSDPSKVGLYGRGGAVQNINFTTITGTPLYNDDLVQVPILHANGKIFFYGIGVVDMNLHTNLDSYQYGGYFTREYRNAYSHKGYYFLSDYRTPLQMTEINTGDTSELREATEGIGFVFHEEDLIHNNSNTGQLFFGEQFNADIPKRQWQVFLPDAIHDGEGAMECVFYCDRNLEGTLTYGLEGTPKTEIPLFTSSSTFFTAQAPTISPVIVPGANSTVEITFQSDSDPYPQISHLDYWTLSYPRTAPSLIGKNGARISQDVIAFPGLQRSRSYRMVIPGGLTYRAFDITEATRPRHIKMTPDGRDAIVKIIYDAIPPKLAIFDPYMPQLQISGYQTDYKEIINQDLHAKAAEGAELLIICIPGMYDACEELAQVHRDLEGMKVLVATTDQCYNEFSSGVPDPMAYRALAKACYSATPKLKNVLLVGPLYADFRGVVNEKQQEEGIIAYQTPQVNQLRGAMNANDFIGMMSDYLPYDAIEKNTMHLGVGVLPCRYPSELRTVTEKVRKYLERDDFAYYLNCWTSIGGVGNNHTHDNQSIQLNSFLNSIDYGATIFTPLVVDAYGHLPAQKKFLSTLNKGQLVVNYFGHGSPAQLNQSGDFFRAADVYRLRNTFHPFMAFAGCEITNSDRGVRGLGEGIVTSTPYGMLGTMLATRETWSGQNMEFFRIFYNNMLRNGKNSAAPFHNRSLTIGEVFAKAKTQSTYNNELAYQLLCDPSIVIPTITRPIVLENPTPEGYAGEFLDIEGNVLSLEDPNLADTSFNGQVVVRLLEPFKTITSADICSANDPDTEHDLDIIYADTQCAMTEGEVVEGHFKVRLFIPSYAKDFAERSAIGRLHIAAFNPETRSGAGSMGPLYYKKSDSATTGDSDLTPPSIVRFEYDPSAHALEVEATDNVALAFNDNPLSPSFKLLIDGKEYAQASLIRATSQGQDHMFKIIPLADIQEGTHSALVKVEDANGNKAQSEIIFTYEASRARLALAMKEKAVDQSATFTISGEIPAQADIVILDNNGMIVNRSAMEGDTFIWQRTDNNGNSVAPGIYKAYVIETGNGTSKVHSPAINVPVI